METRGTTQIGGVVRFLTLLLAASSELLAVTCFAAEYTWNGSSTDWESADAYDNGCDKPSAGDTVKIPANKTATVDNDSIAFVSSLGRISMPYSTSALTINISTNATLGCQVTGMSNVSKEGSGTAIGTVSKRGAGELYLAVGGTSNDYRSQYYVNWKIEGGSIRMPTNSASSTSQLYFGAITVNEGQTLYTAKPGRTRVAELWGTGLVTNESESTSYYLDVYGFGYTRPCVFSGVVGGGIQLYSRGNVNLVGTNNTFRGDCWAWNYTSGRTYGTTGIKTLGMAGQPSSAGKGNGFRSREYSGCFLYLGTGETTDKTIQFDESSYRPAEFDAGAVGGITFTGKWQDNPYSTALNRIVITGSNTAECVLDNAFDSNYGYRLTKKGSGTWRLKHNADRKMTGVVAVQDGTLKFESIAPAGTICSLGKSTALYEDYSDVKSNVSTADYALAIGGDSSKTGTLEYVGADVAFCGDRPLKVTGAGRFRVSGGALTFGGVFADDGGGTLIYDAANGADVTNTLANVADGTDGTLSIVKEGAGTLRLAAGQTWGGSLDVRAGTVLVDSRYGYWRFTIKENAYACTNRYPTARTVSSKDSDYGLIQVSEFGLYDSSGNRLNDALVDKGSNPSSASITKYNATDLEPGEAAVETVSSYKYYMGSGLGRLDNIFDNALGSGNGDGIVVYCTAGIPYLDQPARNLKIVMRLPRNSADVKYYDICNARASGGGWYGRCMTAYSIEGSADGAFWEKVAEDNEAVIPTSSSGWYSGDSTHMTLSVSRALALTNVTSVAVASGATLVANGPVAPIKKLVLDVAGGGTIDGFEFVDKEEGELEIVGSFDGSVTIPVTIRNSTTFANVSKWPVFYGGRYRQLSVSATDSAVTVSKLGMVFIVK